MSDVSRAEESEVLRPEIVLEAGRSEAHYWRDLWRYRELFVFLTWRDLLLRYKQTAIGILWAVLQPALTTVIFTAFSYLLKLPTGGIPRPVLIFAAQLPWSFFSAALSSASGSLVGNANLISKVYFPRLIIPASAVAVSLVDFFVSAAFFAVLLIVFHVMPDARVFALPVFLFIAFATALGAGLWLTALNVKYRDFRIVLPFLLQLGFYISPVAFTSELVPERWRLLYSLNPMVGVIDGFRWSLLGGNTALDKSAVGVSAIVAALLLFSGIAYFRKTERSFADVI